uniref:helix-turn-helix domain-containing protein n=1 Tax=Pantoea anthophila TaxID=470931 RepID=UPI003AFAA040
MSRAATDWAWSLDLKASQKLLLLSLADRADEYHCCYPSIMRLVNDTGLDRKTIGKWINQMIEEGLLSDTGERKGPTKRVRVLKLNLDFKCPQKREGAVKENGPKNGNVPKIGPVSVKPSNDPKNGLLNDPKFGILNDPKNGIQNQSSEPNIEPKNNTHTARSNFESVVNVATAPPHECNNPQMHIGDWVQSGTWSSEELSAPELKTRFTRARHKNPVLPAAIEHVSTLIAQKTGDVQLRVNQPDPFNKHAANHIPDKFVMFNDWRPSSGLRDTAQKIGIELSGPPDQARLADFVTFWEADGAAYNQVQWEMKLARYVEKGRKHLSSKRSRERRDCTRVSEMNYEIP